jgi:uncharacterized protein
MISVYDKEQALRDLLSDYGSVAIAYSGGVDSAYLSDVAHDVLGKACRLVLADSPSIPRAEVQDAVRLAATRGWQLEVIQTEEFNDESYLKNDNRRCYYCKSELFKRMNRYASENQINVLAYGAMVDDLGDVRPGHDAAREYRVVAPLQEAQLGKDEIRELSRDRDLPTWNKASFACMASRVPTGMAISRETIMQIEKAEDVLRRMGFHQFRARHHGDLCRIEIEPGEFTRLLEPGVRDELVREIRAAGYRHVTCDLAGYRTGSTAG